MTFEEAEEIVSRFSTKHPYWSIFIERGTGDYTKLRLRYNGPCSLNNGDIKISHVKKFKLEFIRGERHMKELVRSHWLQAWQHEAFEWLKFDDKLMNDPHS